MPGHPTRSDVRRALETTEAQLLYELSGMPQLLTVRERDMLHEMLREFIAREHLAPPRRRGHPNQDERSFQPVITLTGMRVIARRVYWLEGVVARYRRGRPGKKWKRTSLEEARARVARETERSARTIRRYLDELPGQTNTN